MAGSVAFGHERRIRVLIVDDSAIVRKILTETLSSQEDMEVVGTAPDPIVAFQKIQRLNPDVITLDVEMPRMDGLTFLKQLMQSNPLPVILISSLAQSSCEIAMEALRCGAVEVMAKPNGPYSVGDLRDSICARIRAAARAKLRSSPVSRSSEAVTPPLARATMQASVPREWLSQTVIAIGASTGGTQAISEVLTALPAGLPPILVVQHIPAVFSRAFAERLNRMCALHVEEASDGCRPRPGTALIAPGGFHMVLGRAGGELEIRIKDGPLVQYQRPAVDVLFASVAEVAGPNAIGVILTGMGKDGADGLLRMKQRGAFTIAQDEATSVVFGMPREAIRLGSAERVLPLDAIAGAIVSALPGPSTAAPHRIA